MDNDKKKNIIIIVLSLIIVLLIGFILGSNFRDDETENNINDNQNVNENTNNDEVSYSNWMDYILNSEIQSVTLIRNNEITLSEESRINLTKEDLKNIFVNFKNLELEKYKTTGIGVPVNELSVSYKVNNNIYNLVIADDTIFMRDNDDSKLIGLLDKVAVLEDNGLNDVDSGYVFRFKTSYNTNIYDSYFQE